MKVLFVTNYGAMYGANKSMLNLMIDLRNRYGIDPVVLIPYEGELVSELKKNNIECIVLKHYIWAYDRSMYTGINLLWNKFKWKTANSYLISKLVRVVKPYHFDIIHTNTSITHIGAILAEKLQIPHIWHTREYGCLDYNTDFIYSSQYVRNRFENASCVVAISQSIENFYKKRICPNAAIQVIYNGVNDSYLTQHCIDGKCIQFACVGLIRETKNQLEVIKAARFLIESGIKNFKVNLIGDGNPDYINEIKAYIEKYSLDDYIKLWGYRKDVPEILRKMNVGITPSLNEAFGRVTVEYMMEEMPVIGANTGGTPELIFENHTGYLYESGSYDDLASKMKILLENPSTIVELGQSARKYALSNFYVGKNTDEIYKVYRKHLKHE